MAKRFFCIAAGIFLLVAAYQLGTSRAVADWSGAGWVVGLGDGQVVWNAAGEAYGPRHDRAWERQPTFDLPVPPSSVRLIDGGMNETQILLVTNSDEVWYSIGGGWIPMLPVPGGPVAVDPVSFGKVKAQHR